MFYLKLRQHINISMHYSVFPLFQHGYYMKEKLSSLTGDSSISPEEYFKESLEFFSCCPRYIGTILTGPKR